MRGSGVARPDNGGQVHSPSPTCQGDPDSDRVFPQPIQTDEAALPAPHAHTLFPGPPELQIDLLPPSCLPPCSVLQTPVGLLLGEGGNKGEGEDPQYPTSLWDDLPGPQWGEGLVDVVHKHACSSPPPSFLLSRLGIE